MNPEREDYLRAKYSALDNVVPMDPRGSTQVRATDRAEAVLDIVWPNGSASGALFDPALCPPTAARADEAAREYHRLAADAARERVLGVRPSLRFETHDTDYEPDEPAEQGVLRLWFVDSRTVEIVRDRWHDNPNRVESTASYFGGLLGEMRRDYKPGHDYDPTCNVRIAKACGGLTRVLPNDRGTLVLLFWCCRECETLAGRIAANNHRTAVIAARADLPRGARVLPNPVVG